MLLRNLAINKLSVKMIVHQLYLKEPMTTSPVIHYDALKGTKPGMLKLEINYGPWKKLKEAGKPCWKKSSLSKSFDVNAW